MTTVIRTYSSLHTPFFYMRSCIKMMVVVLVLNACYTPRYSYSPSAHNVPVLAEKGDSKLAVNYSSNGGGNRWREPFAEASSNGADIQGAYAFRKNWAIQSSFFTRHERNGDYSNSDSAVIRYKRNLVDVGIGYFKTIQPSGQTFFQVFAGMGFGKFSFTDNGRDEFSGMLYSRFHEANVTRFYIQPALQLQYKKLVIASLSSRFSILQYNNIKTNYERLELENYALSELGDGPIVFWEPAFVNSFGFKKLPGFQIEYQLGASLLMSRRFIDARTFNFSIGLQSDLGALLQKKDRSSKK